MFALLAPNEAPKTMKDLGALLSDADIQQVMTAARGILQERSALLSGL